MKKIYLLSVLLCAAASLPAQELMREVSEVESAPVKVSGIKAQTCTTLAAPKDYVPRFSNPLVKLGAPADDELLIFTTPTGLYGQILVDETGNGQFSSWLYDRYYAPAMSDVYWSGWTTGDPATTEFEYSLIDLTGVSDDQLLDTNWRGQGVTNLFGYYTGRTVSVTGTYNGTSVTWDRSMVVNPEVPDHWYAAGVEEVTTGFYTPIAEPTANGSSVSSYYISASNYGNLWGYYGGYTDGSYYGDGGNMSFEAPGVVQKFTACTSPLYIFGGNILCSSADGTTPAVGENVSFELWTLEDDQLSECLATATGSSVMGNTTNNAIGSINYEFQDLSGGFPVAAPVVIPAGIEFAVVVRNLIGTHMKIDFTSDYTNGVVGCGGAYYLAEDGESIYYAAEGERSGADLAIGLDVYMPVANFQATYLDVPVAGGAATAYDGELENGTVMSEGGVALASTMPYVDDQGFQHMEITCPDWVTIAADTTGYGSTGTFPIRVTAEALPTGMTNRHGWITVSMYGFERGIRIGQGTGWSGVETTVAEAEVSANVVAGDFVLTYGEGVDKVDVYNVAGSLVASYALPANGSFTVPASDLAKGLYVLNFTGEKKATVKVVK